MWTKTYKVVGFLEPGVVKFGDKNLMIYISKEAIERYSHRLKGKPVTIGHIEGITEENAQKVSVGDVAVCTEPGECIVTIKNEEADRLIEGGERFSCCWVPVKWGEGGTWHNIPYDKELVEMDFTHLAIVPDPRYENVEVFMNSKEHNNASLPKGGMGEAQKRLEKVSPTGMAARPSSTAQYATQVREGRQAAQERTGSIPWRAGTPEAKTQQMHVKISRKVSDFKNSLNPKQYAFLKKYIKEWNNEGEQLKGAAKRKAQLQQERSATLGSDAPYSSIDKMGNKSSAKEPHYSLGTSLKRAPYNNEADAPDNSSERMDRINKYLQKREDRRADQYYKTHEEPKQYASKVSEHFGGYKNCSYRRKDGKEWNNECVKKYLKEHMNSSFKIRNDDNVSVDKNWNLNVGPTSREKVAYKSVARELGMHSPKSLEGRQVRRNA